MPKWPKLPPVGGSSKLPSEPPRSEGEEASGSGGRTPEPKRTDERDRTRFSGGGEGHSVGSMRLTGGRGPVDVDVSVFGQKLGKALLAAVERTAGAHRDEAVDALARLAEHPIGSRIGVALATGRLISKVKPDEAERFLGPTVEKAALSRALVQWGRLQEVSQGLAGVNGKLSKMLREAMLEADDVRDVRKALAWIDRHMKATGDSLGIAAALADAGCLPHDATWVEGFLPGSDPVGALAKRAKAGGPAGAPGFTAAEPEKVAALAEALRAAGVTEADAWRYSDALDHHRGIVGEALRLEQLAAEPGASGRRVEQGVLMIARPPGLDACRTVDEAQAWCRDNGKRTDKLLLWDTPEGPRFSLRESEIDFAVFDPTDAGLRPRRFENVKAGSGSAGTAAKQNEAAQALLTNPDISILFEDGAGGYRDATGEIQRTTDGLALRTVGPAFDPTYDAHLPLSAGDITALTQQLRDAP